MRAVYQAADLFCGAGGSSTGLVQAIATVGARVDLTAINHWNIAVETHAANHPSARHLCESLDNVDPRKVIPGKRLDILTASPECLHHSNARGGKPMDDQSRATAWHVLRWAEALRPTWVLVENVSEFTTWGPLGSNGRPLQSKRGVLFGQFVSTLQALGYRVEWKVLNAANYGAATTRRRFFLVARMGKGPIPWPVQSHAASGSQGNLFGSQKWRAAREVIDWSLRGRSIFAGKPLAENTLKRIAAGARKFWGVELEPFIYQFTHGGRSHGIDQPLPTITGGQRGDLGVVEPFLVPYYGERTGQVPRTHSIDEPLPTIVGSPKFMVAQPFMLGQQSGATARPVSSPCPTVATKGAISLVEPFLVKYYETAKGAQSIHDPLDTVTTRDRHALVDGESDGSGAVLDILIRMLQPHELAAGQGFPQGYKFAGNKTEQTRQIGNAVEVNQARALFGAMLRAA